MPPLDVPVARPLPPTFDAMPLDITTLFASSHHNFGRRVLPPLMQLKAAFGELKLDLRDAVLADEYLVLVCESLCASVEVLLPAGLTVADRSGAIFSSHKVGQTANAEGPVLHLEGWSVCSDVKVRVG